MKRQRQRVTINQLIDLDRYRRRGEVLKSREELTAEKIRKVFIGFPPEHVEPDEPWPRR